MSEMDRFNAMRAADSKRWCELHFDYPHADFCLIWPFARKGGGYAEMGDGILIHRLMCEYRNGPTPSASHYATHSCQRGHDGCVNPNHLRWGTPTENQLERYKNAPVKPRRSITAEQAAEIRALKGLQTAEQTAVSYGISESNVRLIQAGKIWKGRRPDRVFTREEVDLIRRTPWQVKSAGQFAKEFGVGRWTIDRIREGKTYRYFETALRSTPPADGNRT